MPTVTLDVGGLDLVVPCQRAGKAEKRRVGERSYAFAGNERSHIRAELMVIPLVFVNTTPAICADIEQMFALGNQVPCSGDVFNNGGATVICSGDYTDDMEQGGGWRVPGLTLYEVENDETTAGGSTSDTTLLQNTHTTSTDDPTAETLTISGSTGGGCVYVGEALTPPECSTTDYSCGIVYSSAPELSWVGGPYAATTLSGIPQGILVSKGSEGGSAFAYQSSKLIVYLCRGGPLASDAVETIESAYRSGSFFGGVITLPFPEAIAWDVEDGDFIRVELWSRLALTPGSSDPDSSWSLYRQTICYGGGTGVRFGGTLVEL